MNDLKTSPEQEALMKAKIKRAYLICTIIIFSVIIITQFILLLYNDDELSKQFSFASTITSIILSVIAIIMTVVSSDSINSLLHKFRDLHDEIKDTPHKINSSVESISSISEKFEESKTLISNTMVQLDSNVTQISSVTAEMRQVLSKIEQSLHEVDSNFTQSIDSLRVTIKDRFDVQTERPVQSSSITNETLSVIVKMIISSSSQAGLYTIYAFKLSYENRKILNINNLGHIISSTLENEAAYYSWAYMTVISGLSLTYIHNIGGTKFIVSEFNDSLSSSITEEVISTDKRSSVDSKIISAIDKMVNESPDIPKEE